MRIVLASVLLLASMGAGLAQDSDRFSLEKTAEGYVRLDKRTGRISTCVEQSGQLVCRLAADERSAFEDEIDRLRGEVEELEKRVTALEADAGNKALPSEDEFDRTMSYMQRFFRSFLDMVKEFDRDLRGGGAAEDSAPNRT
jgi:molecular chaperone GrpE (heat shock protein)